MLRLTSILIAALCLTFFGCASTPSPAGPSPLDSGAEDDSAPLRFSLHDLRSNQRLTIVSDAWLRTQNMQGGDFTHRRAAFYAQPKSGDEMMVKVVNDAVSNGIWQMLKESKYTKLAKSGEAQEGDDVIQVLEVLTANGPVHMVARRGMPADDGKILRTSVRAFTDVYNNVMQLQASKARPTFQGAAGNQ
ncbi:MAG: hypothetical protein ACI87O_003276 [Planctomycetota bacterium]|jgi:hypothetical protein